eukprot:236780-Alexandrium_andersonii.AAC.1
MASIHARMCREVPLFGAAPVQSMRALGLLFRGLAPSRGGAGERQSSAIAEGMSAWRKARGSYVRCFVGVPCATSCNMHVVVWPAMLTAIIVRPVRAL